MHEQDTMIRLWAEKLRRKLDEQAAQAWGVTQAELREIQRRGDPVGRPGPTSNGPHSMTYNPQRHRRRSIRLAGYDYTQAGGYFVTICTYNRECVFGDMVEGEIRVNEWGEIARAEWFRTAVVRANVVLHPEEFVVMPNHIHGIIWIVGDDGRGDPRRGDPPGRPYGAGERPRGPAPGSVGAVVAQYKSIVTKRINALRNASGLPVWQRNYYEHIIRDEDEWSRIRQYILDNPTNWATDSDNPNCEPRKAQTAPGGQAVNA